MKNDTQETLRQQIIRLLETGPMTIRDISQAVRISEKEACGHLPFIEKSVRRQTKKMVVSPSLCLNCGFEFKKRRKMSKPGKCPKCRETRIQPPEFSISKG